MMGWTEADFSYDVTGGVDFMANVRNQINRYWNDRDQDTILAILKGIFSMSATGTGNIKTANAAFVSAPPTMFPHPLRMRKPMMI